MTVVEWIVGLIQLAIIGAFLLFIGTLVWTWISSDDARRPRRGADDHEPRVHHDPMDDLGDGL